MKQCIYLFFVMETYCCFPLRW